MLDKLKEHFNKPKEIRARDARIELLNRAVKSLQAPLFSSEKLGKFALMDTNVHAAELMTHHAGDKTAHEAFFKAIDSIGRHSEEDALHTIVQFLRGGLRRLIHSEGIDKLEELSRNFAVSKKGTYADAVKYLLEEVAPVEYLAHAAVYIAIGLINHQAQSDLNGAVVLTRAYFMNDLRSSVFAPEITDTIAAQERELYDFSPFPVSPA